MTTAMRFKFYLHSLPLRFGLPRSDAGSYQLACDSPAFAERRHTSDQIFHRGERCWEHPLIKQHLRAVSHRRFEDAAKLKSVAMLPAYIDGMCAFLERTHTGAEYLRKLINEQNILPNIPIWSIWRLVEVQNLLYIIKVVISHFFGKFCILYFVLILSILILATHTSIGVN